MASTGAAWCVRLAMRSELRVERPLQSKFQRLLNVLPARRYASAVLVQ